MFILQVTKVDSLNYSVLFGMKIPTVLTLKFPQVQIAFIFRYLNVEIPRFLSLSALSGVLYGLWLTQSISVTLSFLIGHQMWQAGW